MTKIIRFSDHARAQFSTIDEADEIFRRLMRERVSKIKLVAPEGDAPYNPEDAFSDARSALSFHSRRWRIRSHEGLLSDVGDMSGVVTADTARKKMIPLIDRALDRHKKWCHLKASDKHSQQQVAQQGARYAHMVCVYLVLRVFERIACGERAQWEITGMGLRPVESDLDPCPVASVRHVTFHWLRSGPGSIDEANP